MEIKEREFYKYSSIENSYVSNFVDKIREQGYENIEYCVTEKVHGSNTQLSFDGAHFSYGTRNHYLEKSHW